MVLPSGEIADVVQHSTKLWVYATSLGGVESTLERRRRWKSEPATIPEGLVRLSVGIEDVEDLWEDLAQALDVVRALTGRRGHRPAAAHSWISPIGFPSASARVATSRPPPTSCGYPASSGWHVVDGRARGSGRSPSCRTGPRVLDAGVEPWHQLVIAPDGSVAHRARHVDRSSPGRRRSP